MFTKLSAILISLYLFFVGFIYGDEPIKVTFTYESTSQTQVYQQGDKVKLKVNVTNMGRPFEYEGYFEDDECIGIYQDEKIIYESDSTSDNDATPYIFGRGETKSFEIVFEIPEDVTKGNYDLKVTYKKCSQIFEDVITVI